MNIVSSEHSDDSETPKDTPKPTNSPLYNNGQKKQEYRKKPPPTSLKVYRVFPSQTLFIRKSSFPCLPKHPELRSLSEAEQEELFHAFCSHELTAPLAEAGGDLRRYALLAAAQEMESLARSSIENAVDGMNGNDIREEGISDPREELGISPKDLEAVLEKIEHLSPEGFSEDVRQIIKM